jgi:uncharacterized protein YigA (DUF484 family)
MHYNEECMNVEGGCTTCGSKIQRANFASHDCVSELKITVVKKNEELRFQSEELKYQREEVGELEKTVKKLREKTKNLETQLEQERSQRQLEKKNDLMILKSI